MKSYVLIPSYLLHLSLYRMKKKKRGTSLFDSIMAIEPYEQCTLK
jgi:hypothetical protein